MSVYLNAALKYSKMGYSVIPIKKDKKPYVKWTDFQYKKADELQIKKWWQKHPEANIGIITGAISMLTVIDADSDLGLQSLNEFISDSLTIPTVKTPKGYHLYFKHAPGLSNGTRVITDTDLRTDGGYVIAPPSTNGKGKSYNWLEGSEIAGTKPPEMPEVLFDVLKQGSHVPRESSRTSIYNNKNSSSSISMGTRTSSRGYTSVEDLKRPQKTPKRLIGFGKGSRDDTLFHLANYLVRGGMPTNEIFQYIEFFGKNCNPPFPEKEIKIKDWY